ncbi:MAG: phosphatidate cytidylyltransferase [Sphingomonas sp.]|nr:phosphatidate cytidylyltransferase [Sphingomonas sp.]
MTSASDTRLPSDLALRSIVALGMVAATLSALWLGGIIFWIVCSAVGVGMMGEWGSLIGLSAMRTRHAQFILCVPLAIMGPWGAGPYFFAFGLLIGAACFAVIVTRRAMTGWGVLYVSLPVMGLLLIRNQHDGVILTFWALALVWACDIGAYFAGRAIGGPKLAPAVSPNKTWAGLIGGVGAAAIFGGVMHHYAGLPWRLTLATPVLAVLAQSGDLFESWMKRRAGVKDSGNLLPGHGGLLDRLDGLAPVAPTAAFLVMLPEILGFFR